MTVRSLLGVAMALALPLSGQTTEAPPFLSRVVVPVVGSVAGANGVQWRTDVELRNDGLSAATVSLMLPTAPGQPALLTRIEPGETLRFADVVGQAFGLEAALSPLLVETLGRRSVTVHATAYATRGAETMKPEPIAILYGSAFYPFRTLYGLSFSDELRTNVGIANLGESEATVTLALQRIPGRNLAVSRIAIPGSTLIHVPVQRLFPLITAGEDFVILMETAASTTYVYASVIENATSSATFIQPAVGIPRLTP